MRVDAVLVDFAMPFLACDIITAIVVFCAAAVIALIVVSVFIGIAMPAFDAMLIDALGAVAAVRMLEAFDASIVVVTSSAVSAITVDIAYRAVAELACFGHLACRAMVLVAMGIDCAIGIDGTAAAVADSIVISRSIAGPVPAAAVRRANFAFPTFVIGFATVANTAGADGSAAGTIDIGGAAAIPYLAGCRTPAFSFYAKLVIRGVCAVRVLFATAAIANAVSNP